MPHPSCTCGVYAAKTLERLRQCGYSRFGLYGEVYLWGSVVEHERGWRAEFAYPKTFLLAPAAIPFSLSAIDCQLRNLIAFGTDIFMLCSDDRVALWKNGSGYDRTGLDYLISSRTQYYVRRRSERTLRMGDRVALLGLGIAVLEGLTVKTLCSCRGIGRHSGSPAMISPSASRTNVGNAPDEVTNYGFEYTSRDLRPSQHERPRSTCYWR